MLRQTKKYLTICQDLITAIQVIQPKLGIIVISSVSEGIIICTCVCAAVGISRGMITPSIIGVAYKLCSAFVVNRYNITLQILFEIEGVENVFCTAGCTVLHADGRAGFIAHFPQSRYNFQDYYNKFYSFCQYASSNPSVFRYLQQKYGNSIDCQRKICYNRLYIFTYLALRNTCAINWSFYEKKLYSRGLQARA